MPLPELAFGDDFPESFYVSYLPFPPFGLPVRVPHTTTPLLAPPLPFPTTPPDRPLPPPPSTAATATSALPLPLLPSSAPRKLFTASFLDREYN